MLAAPPSPPPAAPSPQRAPLGPPVFDTPVSARRTALTYFILVVLPVLALLWVEAQGAGLGTPAPAGAEPSATAPSAAPFDLALFLMQIGVILTVARGMGMLMRRLGQPQVVGEMIAGLLLGPSLFGWLAPGLFAELFRPGTVRFLSAVAQLGVVLFMFVMGLEINLRELVSRSRQTLVTSHAGIAVPMFAGASAALFLYPAYSSGSTTFGVFALFLGCAMSITAFPVLARILSEKGLAGTRFGTMAMECAALADITAWVILALVLALGRGSGGVTATLLRAVLGLALYLAVMVLAVRPLVRRLWGKAGEDEGGRLSDGHLGGVVLLILSSAVATELLHVHALFGAFVAGVVMPESERAREAVEAPFRQLLTVLLLPLFFAYAGLRADLGAFTAPRDWILCGAMIVVAVLSKFGGSWLAARAMGASGRNAGALGALMNARGLVELILLTIGLQLGIVTRPLFTAMVVMAVVTTAMTVPLLRRLLPAHAFGSGGGATPLDPV